jgi:hypothetical protein
LFWRVFDSLLGLLPKVPSEAAGDKHGDQKPGSRCASLVASISRREVEP